MRRTNHAPAEEARAASPQRGAARQGPAAGRLRQCSHNKLTFAIDHAILPVSFQLHLSFDVAPSALHDATSPHTARRVSVNEGTIVPSCRPAHDAPHRRASRGHSQ